MLFVQIFVVVSFLAACERVERVLFIASFQGAQGELSQNKELGGLKMKFFREKIKRKEVTIIVKEVFNP